VTTNPMLGTRLALLLSIMSIAIYSYLHHLIDTLDFAAQSQIPQLLSESRSYTESERSAQLEVISKRLLSILGIRATEIGRAGTGTGTGRAVTPSLSVATVLPLIQRVANLKEEQEQEQEQEQQSLTAIGNDSLLLLLPLERAE
jgi:hypothetical protein